MGVPGDCWTLVLVLIVVAGICSRKTKETQARMAAAKAKIEERHRRLGSYSLLFLDGKDSKKLKIGAARAAEVNRKIIEREVAKLDKQAAFTMARYNKELAINQVGSLAPLVCHSRNQGRAQEVRDRVDEVRRERRIFENLFQQMEGELIAQDAETRACNEEAERCYKERDAAQNDMKELKVRPTWPALSVR